MEDERILLCFAHDMQAGKDGRLNGCIACPGAGRLTWDDDDYGLALFWWLFSSVATGGYLEKSANLIARHEL